MIDIQNYRNLAAAICIQAAKDYAKAKTPQARTAIIRQLRSEHMDSISEGKSVLLADALKRDYKTVVSSLMNTEVA